MKPTTLLAACLACGALVFAAGCGGEGDGEQQDPSEVSGSTLLGSCGEIMACSDACPEDSWEACEDSCIAQANASSQELFVQVIDCEDAAWESTCSTACAGTDEDACESCFETACGDTYEVCDGGVDAAPGSCAAILSCDYECPEESYDACFQSCFSQGNANAQQLYGDLDQCWDAESEGACSTPCAGTDGEACDSCLDSACNGQFSACEQNV